jgi:hypothetical protein
MNRKQRKKKWVLAAALALTVALIPAEASSPNLPRTIGRSTPKTCGQKSIDLGSGGDNLNTTWGSCTAGSDNCCYGYPETQCGSGGHFQSV